MAYYAHVQLCDWGPNAIMEYQNITQDLCERIAGREIILPEALPQASNLHLILTGFCSRRTSLPERCIQSPSEAQ